MKGGVGFLAGAERRLLEKRSNQWTLNTKCVKNRVLLWLVLRASGREVRHSADQRRTKITLHRHPKNSALNKREVASSPLFCNWESFHYSLLATKRNITSTKAFFRQNKRWRLRWGLLYLLTRMLWRKPMSGSSEDGRIPRHWIRPRKVWGISFFRLRQPQGNAVILQNLFRDSLSDLFGDYFW